MLIVCPPQGASPALRSDMHRLDPYCFNAEQVFFISDHVVHVAAWQPVRIAFNLDVAEEAALSLRFRSANTPT